MWYNVIERMNWVNNHVEYKIRPLHDYNHTRLVTLCVEDLQPYKEETMEKEIAGAIIDRFICLEGYDFYDDKGNIIDTKEITIKKKQPKYPTTYEECCSVLGISSYTNVVGYMLELLTPFQELLICRDAYWKLAGDWKPDWKNDEWNDMYYIYYDGKSIQKEIGFPCCNIILIFPTEEMRDAFYENFKDLIEICTELL